MTVGKLARMVVRNAVRDRRHMVLSTFGIVVGIGAFVFFLGLSVGVRKVVLGDIFPLERLEVVPKKMHVAGLTMGKVITDETVAAIRARKEVAQAIPRMQLAFPASGDGDFQGRELKFEVGGFCDGIDPQYVADQRFAELFQDWEAAERTADLAPCLANGKCERSDRYWCDKEDNKCHHRVPALVSPTLLQLYNGSVAGSHGLPAVGKDFETLVEQLGGLQRMKFYIGLGDTNIAGSNHDIKVPKRYVEAMLVGISDDAMRIGMTIPIQYVERWNRTYKGDEAAGSYSSVMVTVRDKDDVAGFSAWVKEDEGLALEDSQGERFAIAIFIVTMLFLLISFVIVGISAINIAHTFFMQVSERRREIGVLRAVGATRADVKRIILGEAALIGLIGGAFGTVLAIVAGLLVDAASTAWLPSFPFKPTTYFGFEWWIIGMALGFSVLFCVLGGLLPARRAAAMEPAQALAAQ